MGKKQEKGVEYDQDLELCPSQPREETRKVDIPPAIRVSIDETRATPIRTNAKNPETLPAPSMVAAHAFPAGCRPVGKTSTTKARSTACTVHQGGNSVSGTRS